MNAAGFKMDTSSTTIVVGLAAVIIVYYLIKKAGKAALDAAANVNAGTPYAGYGLPGTLGNAANQLTGGGLATGGTQLGDWLYNFFNPAPTPAPDPNSPATAPNFGVTAGSGW